MQNGAIFAKLLTDSDYTIIYNKNMDIFLGCRWDFFGNENILSCGQTKLCCFSKGIFNVNKNHCFYNTQPTQVGCIIIHDRSEACYNRFQHTASMILATQT